MLKTLTLRKHTVSQLTPSAKQCPLELYRMGDENRPNTTLSVFILQSFSQLLLLPHGQITACMVETTKKKHDLGGTGWS